ncbi:MAG: hypothetical protein ACPGOV_13505 [Magnetovibrionaceae bacterium]
MSALNQLKLSNEKRKIVYDKTSHRRQKMVAALMEQQLLVDALLNNTTAKITHMVTEKHPETGQRQKVEKPKTVKQWFWHNANGTWFIEPRYGNKLIDFGKGQTVIEVEKKENLNRVLDTLVVAVEAGELDKQLEKASAKTLAR